MSGGRFKELVKKYGKVAVGVHFSVSVVSVTGLYVAIKNNVDVESMLEKIGVHAVKEEAQSNPEMAEVSESKKRNRTAELAASNGGALALAFLCSKALLPIRLPITIGLTPPVARFLARRQIIKNVAS